jgi:hypothetical protein
MNNTRPVYCFRIDGDDRAGSPESFVGRNGCVVQGCHYPAAVLMFSTLAQANDFHMQSRGVFAGRILRLHCYPAEWDG